MCDTLTLRGPHGVLFAKNSDRPVGEVQLVGAEMGRRPGGEVRTQYLTLADAGAMATLLARPTWLWGAEHGVNDHRVAIGNEEVYTTADLSAEPDGLLGMDLVRLGLERGASAEEALDVITGLVSRHGQGGIGNAATKKAYSSSFVIADPSDAWILETAGRVWAARPAGDAAAVSNRLSLGTDWTRASSELSTGDDFDAWRDRSEPTGHADLRLAASNAFLASCKASTVRPASVVAHLRDHGHGPWGAPGGRGTVHPPPGPLQEDFTGFSVCLHIRDLVTTTSSMVASLPADPAEPLRVWVAAGSPCVSVFVPAFPAQDLAMPAVPPVLGDETTWHHSDELRQRVEADPDALGSIREVLDPVEDELWQEADEVAGRPILWGAAVAEWSRRVRDVTARLAAGGGSKPS